MCASSSAALRRASVFACAAAMIVLAAGPARSQTNPAPQGTWIQIAPPTLREHCGIYDPVRQRLVVFGGWDPGAPRYDVWTLSLTGSPVWQNITPSGSGPSARADASAIYDPVGDRLIVFGGSSGSNVLGDVWALSLGAPVQWKELTPGGGPGPRLNAAAIYDPAGRRMLIFAGSNGTTALADVWALSLDGAPAWSQVVPAGSPPTAGSQYSAAYDPVRQRMIVGQTSLWVLSLGATPTWTQISPLYFDPGHRIIYDPNADRLVRYGNAYFPANPAVYTLSLSTPGASWQSVNPPGPLGRQYHVMVYDSYQRQMVVFGGWSSGWYNDAWSMPLVGPMAWTRLSPLGSTPPGMISHAAIFDPVGGRMLVYPGDAGGVVWAYGSASGWQALTPASGPPQRLTHSAMYDPVRRRMLVFGGSTNFGNSFYGDLWGFGLDGPPQWTPVPTVGTPPAARGNHTAVYDGARDRMILFGGDNSNQSFNDTWTLDLTTTPPVWTQLSPLGAPPTGLTGHAAVFDAAGNRMIVFGGNQGSPHVIYATNTTWTLQFAGTPTWTQLATGGTPPLARKDHTALLDPLRSRMIVFGGQAFSPSYLNDAWSLDLVTRGWAQLQPAQEPPGARFEHTAVLDAFNDQMIVFGGESPNTYYKDLWMLRWSDFATAAKVLEFRVSGTGDGANVWWSVSDLAPGDHLEIERAAHPAGPWTVIEASASTRGQVADRDVAARTSPTTWYRLLDVDQGGTRATLSQAEARRPESVASLTIGGPSPHLRGELLEISYALARPSWMRLCVYDVTGRLCSVLVEGHQLAGEGHASWSLRDVGSGVYFVSFETSDSRRVRRVVVAG